MKHLFAKWLSALLIAALLLTPVALMEETPDEPATVEAVVSEAAPDEEPVEESDEEPIEEPDEEPIEEPVEETDEIIFEDVDVIVGEADAAELEAEEECFEETEAEFVSDEAADALYGAESTPDVDGSGNIKLNATNFPDDSFRNYIIDNFDNSPKDDVLSDDELKAITSITVPSSVTDATGVKLLKYIQGLSFEIDCIITTLDVSGCSALKNLSCGENQLTALNVSGCTALQTLYCDYNQLTALDVSGCTVLETLSCYYNKLSSLDVSGCSALKSLSCNGNQLTALDVSGCSALKDLYCYGNQLTALNVSGFTALESLSCNDNKLSSLDVSGCTALDYLYCDDNQLTALDVSGCSALDILLCNKNQLTALDVSDCTTLVYLSCEDNQLTALNVTGCTALDWLDCDNNQLTTLDIRNCTAFAEHVTSANYTLSESGNSVIYKYDGDIYVYLRCDRYVTIIGGNPVSQVPEGNTSPGSTISNPGADSGAVTTAPQEPITIASVPAKVKAKAKKNKVTVSWKKLKKSKKNKAMFAQIKGIEVQCSTDPGFTQNVVTKSVGKKKAKAVFKLQKKTTYYVRMRYIDKTGGVSNWSAVRKVKTK